MRRSAGPRPYKKSPGRLEPAHGRRMPAASIDDRRVGLCQQLRADPLLAGPTGHVAIQITALAAEFVEAGPNGPTRLGQPLLRNIEVSGHLLPGQIRRGRREGNLVTRDQGSGQKGS